ncbi:hypothetical protein DFJ74DRAFT_703259 [Hyaloraphidium curvatum]|nr:hypothetical protein DFJ74DRAFT_703259 [Hyaloraphidium curvatum]
MGVLNCCGRFTLFVVCLIMLAIGIASIVIGSYGVARFQSGGNIVLGGFIAFIVLGALASISAVVGFACTCTSKRGPFNALRVLLILTLIAAAAAAGLGTYIYTKYGKPTDEFLLQVWNDLPQSARDSFQNTYNCTGFEGCLPNLRDIAQYASLATVIAGWVLFAVTLIALIFAFSIKASDIEAQAAPVKVGGEKV